jgi:hypothetical protein
VPIVTVTRYRAEFPGGVVEFVTHEAAQAFLVGMGHPGSPATAERIQDDRPDLVHAAWTQADEWGLRIDHNDRAAYLLWLIDAEVSATAKGMILANYTWADSVWSGYYAAKASIMAGGNPTMADPGFPPHSFAEILAAK